MTLEFSIVVPVYNRPEEIKELLDSLKKQTYKHFEVVIVDDGSNDRSESVVNLYGDDLKIQYHYKNNTGPGDSRNFGMKQAEGNYFIILDSDCILPSDYLEQVYLSLSQKYVDCFGGVDAAHDSFSNIQKAINFSMTSFLTTGGVRGASEKITKFQPRSFNMGISRKAFLASGGFGGIHPGEDPDLSIRLWKLGFETRLIPEAKVFHKRRISWSKFRLQVNKFGKVRPILDLWHPEYAKLTFWFPGLFVIGFVFSIFLMIMGFTYLFCFFMLYFLAVFLLSSIQYSSLKIGIQSVWAVIIQFFGYGSGFLQSFWKVKIKRQKPEEAFPDLFFIS